MRRRILLTNLIGLWVIGAAACGKDEPLEPSPDVEDSTCAIADDCPGEEICLQGTCADVPGATPPPDTTGPADAGDPSDAADAGGPQDDTAGTDAEVSGDAGDDPGPDVPDDPPPPAPNLEPFTLDFHEIALPEVHKRVTGFAFIPGTDGELLLLQQPGKVFHYALDAAGDTATLLGSFILENTYLEQDCGLISVAFDPEFSDNGFIYMAHCVDVRSSSIYRLVFDPADYDAIPPSKSLIITVGDPEPEKEKAIHNVGSIGFYPDTFMMWALFGEKRNKPASQDLSNNLGTVLRILPNREPGGSGYEPAPGNPFAEEEGASPDIFAYGLRSPWKGVLDAHDRLWIGDVGSDDWEEVNLLSEPGQNFGWPDHEGYCTSGCAGVTDPTVTWGHTDDNEYVLDDDEAIPAEYNAVWLGGQYRHLGNDPYEGRLTGKTLFGDACFGWVRAVQADASGAVIFNSHVGHMPWITGTDQAADGFLYAVSYGNCVSTEGAPTSHLYRVVIL